MKTESILNKNLRDNNARLLILFIFWPFLGFLLALKNFQNKFNQKIILIFFVLFGLLFYVNPLQDGQRRADGLKEAYNQPFEMAFNTFDNLYKESLDFIEPLIVFTVSRFTDFHGVLFGVYAFIFGGLMIYYLNRVHLHFLKFPNINAFIFLILLIFVNPINGINGFRMWTAAWIFSVGVINYLHEAKWRHILFASIAMFLHFSFGPLIVLLFIYKLLGNRALLFAILAIITFFIAELNIKQVQSIAKLISPATETKISAYTNEDYIEKVALLKNQSAWFVTLNQKGMLYYTLALLVIIYVRTRGVFKNRVTDNFYSFTLLLLSFANISALLPSGGRFYTVFNIFVFTTGVLYYVYELKSKKLELINWIGLPLVILFVIFSFRLFTDPASLYLFGPSFFMPIAFFENTSLQSILF
jgi:hypothetical protein